MRVFSRLKTRVGRIGQAALLGVLLAPLGACVGGDSLTRPPSNDGLGEIPWDVNPEYRAINLVVGETVQLKVNPTYADGTPYPADKLPPVQYQTADTAIHIDANGVLTALAPKATITIPIVIEDTENNWTIRDQIQVRIIEPADKYPIEGFRLQAEGYQYDLEATNGYQPMNRYVYYRALALDAAGNPLTTVNSSGDTVFVDPLVYRYTSANRSDYYISGNYGYATTKLVEPTVYASTYAFGKYFEDSASVKVTYPDSAIIYLVRQSTALNPSPTVMPLTDLTILKGGKIWFRQLNTTSPGDDIVFDDLTKVENGNIPVVSNATSGANVTIVTFPNTGEFTYKSNTVGVTGKITVIDWPTD